MATLFPFSLFSINFSSVNDRELMMPRFYPRAFAVRVREVHKNLARRRGGVLNRIGESA
jgi:hypothetical protein